MYRRLVTEVPQFDASTWVVDVDGGRLFGREVGNGDPTIVVVHGGPDFDHGYLLPEMDGLAASFRLAYYDQRGRGSSTLAGKPDSVTIQSEVDDLDAIRSYLGLDQIVVLGHSWGGLLAMEYAIRHRDRVSHLVLVNTAPVSAVAAARFRQSLSDSRSPHHAAALGAILSSARYQSGNLDADADYYGLHFAHALSRPDQLEPLVGRLRRHMTSHGLLIARQIERGLYDQTWSRPDYDLGPHLRTLDVPTLLLCGDQDFIPIDVAGDIHEQLPDSELVVIEQCGHFIHLEQPNAFHQALRTFLLHHTSTSVRTAHDRS
jgi:proline iminopeptidase